MGGRCISSAMASHAPAPPQRLSIEEFLDEYGCREDGNWELDDGIPMQISGEGMPRMMSGGVVRHARVAGNIFATLHARLRGTGCEPFIFDMLVRTGERSLRLPDVAIYCDPDDIGGDGSQRVLTRPSIVFSRCFRLRPRATTVDASCSNISVCYRSTPSS